MSHYLDFVYDFINAALPAYSVLRASQSAIIPTSDFISYDVESLDVSSFGSYTDGDLYADPDAPEVIGTFDRTFNQRCPLTINVKCYSSTGLSDLQSLCSYAHSDVAIAFFETAFASYQGAGVVTNAKALADNSYLPCFIVNLEFLKGFTRLEAMNAILDFNGTGNFSDLNGAIVADLREGD